MLGREKQSANIAGFYSPKKRTKERVGDANPNEKENREGGADGECGDDVMCVKEMDKLTLEENCEGIKEEKEEENEEEEEENEGEDDDEGWITPENLRKACEEMGGVLDVEAQSLPVGCITTDYAMQASPPLSLYLTVFSISLSTSLYFLYLSLPHSLYTLCGVRMYCCKWA